MNSHTLFVEDANGREIVISTITNAQCIGQSHYPSVQLWSHSEKRVYYPINETIMSLAAEPFTGATAHGPPKDILQIEKNPVFFCVYNVENYYHFLYDTLPYLISFKHLKRLVPNLKLLVNSRKQPLNRFVTEFFALLGISQRDLVFFDANTLYRVMYVSSSYTHGGLSNQPPRKEIYDLYKMLAGSIKNNLPLSKKIYISRRSDKHGMYDNIGTNYTTRRQLVNEDELVYFLQDKGYVEVFTELLTTEEKIALFKDCSHVVGPIGGGICNVLFSKPDTKLTAIVSPHFLDINSRFKYSFTNVKTNYFIDTYHVEQSTFKRYMRVKIKDRNIIGEITGIDGDYLCVKYSDDVVAGWTAGEEYKHVWVLEDNVQVLDQGLNSAWSIDMNKFERVFSSYE